MYSSTVSSLVCWRRLQTGSDVFHSKSDFYELLKSEKNVSMVSLHYLSHNSNQTWMEVSINQHKERLKETMNAKERHQKINLGWQVTASLGPKERASSHPDWPRGERTSLLLLLFDLELYRWSIVIAKTLISGSNIFAVICVNIF